MSYDIVNDMPMSMSMSFRVATMSFRTYHEPLWDFCGVLEEFRGQKRNIKIKEQNVLIQVFIYFDFVLIGLFG